MKLFYLIAFFSLSLFACTDELSSLQVSNSAVSNTYFSSPEASYYLLNDGEYILLEWEKLYLIELEWIKSVESLEENAARKKLGESSVKGTVIIEVYPDKLEMALGAAA